MTDEGTIDNIIKTNNGMITTAEAVKSGISRPMFYEYVKDNELKLVSRGIYATADAWIDDMYVLHIQYPDAVFSHEESLYYSGFTDREPLQHIMTVKTGYNPWRMKEKGIKVYTVKQEMLSVGKIYHKDNYGFMIPIYDKERTICDIVRSRSYIEIQDYQSAIKAYSSCEDKDITKLMHYATLFHVDRIIRQYMDVML